ncbi:wax ester/triacylglycerol synthase domain-containing protein [Dactylosporangium sucinum]|uniref:diacylglycerol O-acyltransferase n=1 Tax=Dactylosporangium sucinum TaxID=1424081 RepID=A0A917TZH2_9ACTN|nr:wax ester/triacylglycerol synthase domain-containing protein [Dactylosporangium sucinum]GGM45147.1 diacylglycerol O-acyltransferase [Dactylosporangium sucinum]
MVIERLSAFDLTNLAVETPDAPMHVGVVAVVDGRPLLDAGGRLRLDEVHARLRDGLGAAPRLRQVVHRPGPLAGRPVWADDPAFRVERHVATAALDPPGGEAELLRLAERLMAAPLDRARPLWYLWIVTGLPERRLAVVVKLHHAVGDGVAAVRLLGALLDPPPRSAAVAWVPAAPPRWGALVVDRLHRTPQRRRRLWRGAARTMREAWAAPRTSLNGPVGAGRRLGVVRLDLAGAKAVARAAGGTVTDVLLAVVGGGLRDLLLARGEPVDGVQLRVAVTVSLRGPDDPAHGNRNGSVVVRLPLHRDPGARLRAVAAATARAKRGQTPVAQQWCMVAAARAGLARRLGRGQRMVNLVVSNVPGPAAPVRMLGAPVLDLVPVGALAGNLAVSVLALSYAGRLVLAAVADQERFPDLPVALAGMERDWARLAR